MMVYGTAGIGKTPLLSTAPGIIVGSAENGLLSIRKTHTPYVEIRNYADLIELYQWWSTSHEAQQFYCLGLDSMSEIAETVLEFSKRTAKDPRQAYGAVIDNVVMCVKAFRDLPGRSVVLLAKEDYEKDEGTGSMLYQPMMPGKQLGPKLPYYFDEVYRMTRYPQNPAIVGLNTVGGFNFVSRSRAGNLAPFEQPNLTYIFKKILGI